jgi:hypothetical protein
MLHILKLCHIQEKISPHEKPVASLHSLAIGFLFMEVAMSKTMQENIKDIRKLSPQKKVKALMQLAKSLEKRVGRLEASCNNQDMK